MLSVGILWVYTNVKCRYSVDLHDFNNIIRSVTYMTIVTCI